MQYNKLKTDRKLMREIDVRLARYATIVGVFFVFSFIASVTFGDLIRVYPKLIIFFGILLSLPVAFFLFHTARFDHTYGSAPLKWRQLFNTFFVINSAVYSLFCLIAFVISSENLLVIFLITANITIACIVSFLWRAYEQIAESFCLILFAPLVINLFLSDQYFDWVVGLILIVLCYSLIYVVRYNQHVFWQRLGDQFLLKEKMKDLETTRRKLKYLSEQRVDLLTDLTHEIRTPMNSVLGMLSLLKDTGLDENQLEILKVAEYSGVAMLSLFEDILDFSKIASGNIGLASSVFNLRYCIESVLELQGPTAHEKGIELSCVCDSDVPVRARGDEHRVSQILNNLIANAIKFSESGEVVVSVHMSRISDTEGMLRVQVVDQGVGISREKQDELFRAFHKADASTTRRHSGTGLGLAISKGLVEAMHGQIGLISDVGEGSTFWFTARLALSTQQVAPLPPHKLFMRQRALIVGLLPGLMNSVRQYMSQWGIDCDTFDKGYDKALQHLRNNYREGGYYDILVLDLGLEYTGNLKLAQLVSEDPMFETTRIVLLTTLEQRGVPRLRQISEKIDRLALVTKPVQGRVLYGALSYLYGVEPVAPKSTFKAKQPILPNKRFSILVVEDNKVHQMIARGMIKKLGYSTKVVNNGFQALEILEEMNFDLILMDCHMPECDGYDATTLIRQNEKLNNKSVPIIGMTADTAETEHARGLASGMDHVLVKPISIEELDSQLRLWLCQEKFESGVMSQSSFDQNAQGS